MQALHVLSTLVNMLMDVKCKTSKKYDITSSREQLFLSTPTPVRNLIKSGVGFGDRTLCKVNDIPNPPLIKFEGNIWPLHYLPQSIQSWARRRRKDLLTYKAKVLKRFTTSTRIWLHRREFGRRAIALPKCLLILQQLYSFSQLNTGVYSILPVDQGIEQHSTGATFLHPTRFTWPRKYYQASDWGWL